MLLLGKLVLLTSNTPNLRDQLRLIMEKLMTPFSPETTEKLLDGLTHFQSMTMVLMTTGLLSKLLKRMFPFFNLNPRKTSTERERSTMMMVMVLKTTLKDQEMNSMISTTQINLEMPEMIFITLITETFQDISDLKNTSKPQPK